MSYWYLATPYTNYPRGREAAFKMACKQAALLMQAGVPVLSPIAHSHPIAVHGDISEADHDFWMLADRPLMDAAKGLLFCQMEGWADSAGMSAELAIFAAAGKPILPMVPWELPVYFRGRDWTYPTGPDAA